MQEDEGGHDAAEAKRERLAELPLAALPVHAGVESQTQAKRGPQILEEASKGVVSMWTHSGRSQPLGFL